MEASGCPGQTLVLQDGAASKTIRAPPGLPVTEVVLSNQNALLSEKNRRLAEENARLLQSQLEQQHAELSRQNAALKQQAQHLRKKKQPPPGTWGPPGAWSTTSQGERRLSLSNQSSDSISNSGSHTTPGSFVSDASDRAASSFAKSDAGQGSSHGETMQTTVMMRNIPNDYSRDMLVELLDKHGFAKLFDLVYLPIDFSSQAGFGYSFVNLVSADVAERFRVHFQGFRGWELPSDKVCDVLWSAARQGLQANVERFKNSPVMHESVPDKFKPALFVDGVRVPFPPPTRKPRAPDISGKSP